MIKLQHLKRRIMPFMSLVGQEDMKCALILNAINPRIGGVLIRGEKGTAKSTAVRSLADLLEDIAVVEGCTFNCSPQEEGKMCDLCLERRSNGQIRVAKRRMPVVDLPLGATEDRVVGSLDVERAIKEGIKALEPGILAAANRGILYIDEVNLLDDHVADVLLDSAAMGVNVVEREGVSVAHPARFILVGTMNPEEGELRPQLLDRFGLQVSVEVIEDVEQRMEIARRAERFEAYPETMAKEFEAEQERLRGQISRAKTLLASVRMDEQHLRTIAATCIDLGIKTHRAEIVVSRTAKTIAAFEGRSEVSGEDVKKAMRLALAHRMRSRPFEPPALNQELLEKSIAQHSPPENEGKRKEEQEEQEKPMEAPSGREAEGGAASSEHEEEVFAIGDPIDPRKVSMLRRRDRQQRRKTRGRRLHTLSLRRSGRYLRSRLPRKGYDIAIDATIRAAAPYQRLRKGPNAIKVQSQDIREKERVGKTSSIVMFVVDASGSMGAVRRMESAKGAVMSLLTDSYQKRDKIGMVAFRGKEAELVLPPSSSADLAARRLRDMPTGGKTPLSAGLSKALHLLKSEMRKDDEARPMMVLISDGRANVALEGDVKEELKEISERTKDAGIHTIVVDTEVVGSSMEMRLGYCKLIAETAGGSYYPISGLTPESVFSIVEGEQQLLFDKTT
jgi:magnesium chelatase subunit D